MESCFKSYGSWELRKKLGSGAFGEVHLWKNTQTNLEIATKSLKKNNTLGLDEEHKMKQRWQQEFELSRNLDTDYIVRGVQLEDKNFLKYLNDKHEWHPLPVLIMEYCNGGDLRAQLKKWHNLNGMIEFEIRNVLRALRGAIDYMHNRCNIKHRDLKPDNIVIHELPRGEKIYKLTDFGFARFINEGTMLQSVVGTRNYFAPEVVDTSEYTKTVDYWSVGIIAFEMLCGNLPFIPHQSLYHTINAIKAKPSSCIAITESFQIPKEFVQHECIFDENRVSNVFRNNIESWLRLALDSNFRTRGMTLASPSEIPNAPGGRINKFYSALDELLKTQVLTVFNLNNYNFYDYEIKPQTLIKDLVHDIARDSNIPLHRLYSILPVGHPLKHTSQVKKAQDFYVEQWMDINDQSNPRVMLYIVDIENKDETLKIPEPRISTSIKHCLRITETSMLPLWLFQKFAFDIHFLLANEQHQLTTLLYGLREYAMTVEDEIFNKKSEIDMLIPYAHFLNGCVLQYGAMIAQAKAQLTSLISTSNWYKNFFIIWDRSVKKFQDKIQMTINKIIPSLLARSSSALRRMREESQRPFYDELVNKDVFEIEQFRQHLQAKHQDYKFEDLTRQVNGCKYCCDAVYRFVDKRTKILNGIPPKNMRDISGIHKEHRLIHDAVNKTSNMLKELHDEIQKYTADFNKQFIDSLLGNAPEDARLVLDGNKNLTSSNESLMKTSINGLCTSMNEVMDLSTVNLIREAEDHIQLMSMDIDMSNDIPATVNFN